MGSSTLSEAAPDTSEPEGPAVYRTITIGTGIGAAVVTAGYSAAAALALAEEVRLPELLNAVCLTGILGLSLICAGSALLQRARLELLAERIAADVAGRVAGRVEAAMTEAAERNYARTVAAVREIVTSELVSEQLDAAVRRAHRYGMITEASGRANVASIRRN